MIKIFRHDEKDYPLHFWATQFITYIYLLYRLISRDYSVYGLINSDYFDYPRFITNLYPPKLTLELINFHWIYNILDYPTSDTIVIIQYILIIFSLLGLLGVFNKYTPIVCFFGYLHLTGFVQAATSEIDGGTVCILALFVLMVSNKKAFYTLFNQNKWLTTIDNRWPIVLLMLLIGSYYLFAGLNKIIDVHPLWPFTLHLDNLAIVMEERSIFVSSRYAEVTLAPLFKSEFISIFAGTITLISELGMGTLIFLPRYRVFFVINMIIMHIFVYYSTGINFLGSSLILILCVDWNCLVRKVRCYYDHDCGFCVKSVNKIKKYDIFNRVNFIPMQSLDQGKYGFKIEQLKNEMGLLEENGQILYGAYAFESIFEKIPIFYIIALIYKFPLVSYFADKIYKLVAKNRHLISRSGCKI